VRFEFKTKTLELLYTEEKGARRYPAGVVDAFFEAMQVIASAVNENDLRALKSYHFEKLSGRRSGQYSLRLNNQFRLIVELQEDSSGKLVLIVEIVDYHQ